MSTRLCRRCGAEFAVNVGGAPGRPPAYCSDECRHPTKYQPKPERIEPPNPSGICQCGCGGTTNRTSQRNQRAEQGDYQSFIKGHSNRRPRVCVTCGVVFLSTNGGKKYCSEACYFSDPNRVVTRTRDYPLHEFDCKTCGKHVAAHVHPNTAYCSDDCKPKIESTARPSETAACEWCGSTFARPQGSAFRFCSESCRNTRKAKRAKYLRRSIFVEDVSLGYLIERDGGKCRLCGKPVDVSKSTPHPWAPTIDHIDPVSKGGLHEKSNCQLAHFRCNCVKGNRGSDQLLLIG